MRPGSGRALSDRRALGSFGEQQAAAYLLRQGYTIVARNWRCPHGEIDLITRYAATLVFVEVRTRRSARYGSPEESITAAKRARLVALAYTYLADHSLDPDAEWRIDLVAITASGHSTPQLRHIVSAIEEM